MPWLLLDALQPSFCFSCGNRLGSTQALGACHRCWMGLDPAVGSAANLPGGGTVATAVHYTRLARTYLLRAKFGRRQELFGPMGRMLLAVFRRFSFRPACIVPVPSHPWNTRMRGFTPSLELSRAMSRATGIPIRPLLRRRWRPWTTFKQLDRAGRKRLAARAFRLPRALDGESVLLVDDLMTTGHTLAACERCCVQSGAAEINALVWARANDFKFK